MKVLNHVIEMVEVDKLRPHPRNPNRGDVDAIHESIEENGFYGVVVAQLSTGYILAGNHTWQAAQKAGGKTIPVAWLDVDDEHALRILLADNRTRDLASYDTESLAELLQEIVDDTGSLLGTGFDEDALDELLAELEGGLDGDGGEDNGEGGGGSGSEGEAGMPLDESLPEEVEARAKSGDVWTLGDHRLYVADHRAPMVQAQVAEWEPDTILFDPPFQWRNVYGWIPPHSIRQTLIVFTDAFRLVEAVLAATAKGWPFRFEFVWDGLSSWYTEGRPLARHKTALVFGSGRWKFRQGTFINPAGEIKHLTTVFEQANNGVENAHPHAKPLAWIRALLAGVGAERIWDPCLGSGTTIMAAEDIGAVCWGAELEPEAADVALARWEEAGHSAERTGEVEAPEPDDRPVDPDPDRYERSKFYRSKLWRDLRNAALERDNETCVKCGAQPGRAGLQVDHIVPRSEGGPDELSNLETLCNECHGLKTFEAARRKAAAAAEGEGDGDGS